MTTPLPASLSLCPLLAALALGCGADGSSPQGPLPEDPVAALAALESNCGTVSVALTPLRPAELLEDPFALPAEAGPVSAHRREAGAAQGAWSPSALASAFSLRHPLIESSLVNPKADPALCQQAMALFSEQDSERLSGGGERRTRVYFAQAVTRFEAPAPAEALRSEGARIPAGAFTASLRRVVSEGRPVAGGGTVWREEQTREHPVRMRCEQGLELASRFAHSSAEEHAAALEAGSESGTYCEARGDEGFRCVGYAPQPTLQGCTLVVEGAALTTKEGRSFRASLAGTLVRRGSAEDPYYTLTLDKVRVE